MIPGVDPQTLITGYGPAVALAFAAAWVMLRLRSQQAGLPDLGTPMILSAIVGVLGARAFYLSSTGALTPAELFQFQPGGMTVAGGLAVAIPVSALLVRWWKVEGPRPAFLWWRLMDGAAEAFAVGVIVERVAAFVAGIDFGSYAGPTDLGYALAVRYPADSPVHTYQELYLQNLPGWTPDLAAPVHPVQLYTAAAGVVMLLVARWLRSRTTTHGLRLLALLAVFVAIHMVVLEFVRFGASELVWGPVHLHQVGGIGLLLAIALAARQLVRVQGEQTEVSGADNADG